MSKQIQIIPAQDENVLGKSLLGAIQGFSEGRKIKEGRRKTALEEAVLNAKIKEIERKGQGLEAPVPSNYFRDPYTGKLHPQDPYRGRGTTVNLPFSFDSGQKQSGGQQVFNDPSQADASGLPAGTVVMVVNPATGQQEPYEI